jgi:hypothetical protein
MTDTGGPTIEKLQDQLEQLAKDNHFKLAMIAHKTGNQVGGLQDIVVSTLIAAILEQVCGQRGALQARIKAQAEVKKVIDQVDRQVGGLVVPNGNADVIQLKS